jgi:hypothetical protein
VYERATGKRETKSVVPSGVHGEHLSHDVRWQRAIRVLA